MYTGSCVDTIGFQESFYVFTTHGGDEKLKMLLIRLQSYLVISGALLRAEARSCSDLTIIVDNSEIYASKQTIGFYND